MAKAKNKVIAGANMGKAVSSVMGKPYIVMGFTKSVYLDNTTVETYEVVTDEHRKSASSGVARGLIGGALLGPVGMLAGGLSAKNKGIYQVAIQFKNGTKSLLEVGDKIYKAIIASCF